MPRNPDIWRDTEVLEAWRSIEGLECVTCASFIPPVCAVSLVLDEGE